MELAAAVVVVAVAAKDFGKIEVQLWRRLKHQRLFYSRVLKAVLCVIVLRSVLPCELKVSWLMKCAANMKLKLKWEKKKFKYAKQIKIGAISRMGVDLYLSLK
jgi:hypothetical protein